MIGPPSGPALAAATAAAAGVASWLGTGALIPRLRRAAVLDHPNERSSHIVPTPRGGGIAVVSAILAAWLTLTATGILSARLLPVPAAAALLALVSWRDDRGGLSPLLRLLAQFGAVGIGIVVLLPDGPVFQGWVTRGLDLAAAAILWVWFVNLFNFMDGIDGLAGSEAASIGGGLSLVLALGVEQAPGLAAAAAVIAAASIGFLRWNWAPARVFLGDVGSVPLGYLLGFLLLAAAARGHWLPALILPLYFLADATVTLCRRLLRGEQVWQAHREHFYQRAVRRGLGHAKVVKRVVGVDLVLILCAWVSERGWPLAALAVAGASVALLLAGLTGWPRPAGLPIGAIKRRIEEKPR